MKTDYLNNPAHRRRPDRGLADAGTVFSLPEIWVWLIVTGFMKNNVGNAAVFPLVLQQGLQFKDGTLRIEMYPADGGKSRVPRPLMRVEFVRGDRIAPVVVFAEYLLQLVSLSRSPSAS